MVWIFRFTDASKLGKTYYLKQNVILVILIFPLLLTSAKGASAESWPYFVNGSWTWKHRSQKSALLIISINKVTTRAQTTVQQPWLPATSSGFHKAASNVEFHLKDKAYRNQDRYRDNRCFKEPYWKDRNSYHGAGRWSSVLSPMV